MGNMTRIMNVRIQWWILFITYYLGPTSTLRRTGTNDGKARTSTLRRTGTNGGKACTSPLYRADIGRDCAVGATESFHRSTYAFCTVSTAWDCSMGYVFCIKG